MFKEKLTEAFTGMSLNEAKIGILDALKVIYPNYIESDAENYDDLHDLTLNIQVVGKKQWNIKEIRDKFNSQGTITPQKIRGLNKGAICTTLILIKDDGWMCEIKIKRGKVTAQKIFGQSHIQRTISITK